MRSWIARRTLRAFAKRYGYDVSYLLMMLNHSPAAFFKFAPLMKAAAMAIDGDKIAAIYIVRNPDKLRHLSPTTAH